MNGSSEYLGAPDAVFRAVLGVLGAVQLIDGLYALLAPRSFYEDFPFGRGWVEALPAYNEHLVRDVGALFLATAVVLLAAAWFLGAPAGRDRARLVPGLLGPALRLPLVQPRAVLDRRRDRQRRQPAVHRRRADRAADRDAPSAGRSATVAARRAASDGDGRIDGVPD